MVDHGNSEAKMDDNGVALFWGSHQIIHFSGIFDIRYHKTSKWERTHGKWMVLNGQSHESHLNMDGLLGINHPFRDFRAKTQSSCSVRGIFQESSI